MVGKENGMVDEKEKVAIGCKKERREERSGKE